MQQFPFREDKGKHLRRSEFVYLAFWMAEINFQSLATRQAWIARYFPTLSSDYWVFASWSPTRMELTFTYFSGKKKAKRKANAILRMEVQELIQKIYKPLFGSKASRRTSPDGEVWLNGKATGILKIMCKQIFHFVGFFEGARANYLTKQYKTRANWRQKDGWNSKRSYLIWGDPSWRPQIEKQKNPDLAKEFGTKTFRTWQDLLNRSFKARLPQKK